MGGWTSRASDQHQHSNIPFQCNTLQAINICRHRVDLNTWSKWIEGFNAKQSNGVLSCMEYHDFCLSSVVPVDLSVRVFHTIVECWRASAANQQTRNNTEYTQRDTTQHQRLESQQTVTSSASTHIRSMCQAQFLIGMTVLCRGTLSEKLKFLFHLYDEKQNAYISRAEFSRYLCILKSHHVPLVDVSLSPVALMFSSELPAEGSHAHAAAQTHKHTNKEQTCDKQLQLATKGTHSNTASGPTATNSVSTFDMIQALLNRYTNQSFIHVADALFDLIDTNHNQRIEWSEFERFGKQHPQFSLFSWLLSFHAVLPSGSQQDEPAPATASATLSAGDADIWSRSGDQANNQQQHFTQINLFNEQETLELEKVFFAIKTSSNGSIITQHDDGCERDGVLSPRSPSMVIPLSSVFSGVYSPSAADGNAHTLALSHAHDTQLHQAHLAHVFKASGLQQDLICRLISVFSSGSLDATISLSSYLSFLSTCCRGSVSHRVSMLFACFDVDGDEYLNSIELQMFIHTLLQLDTALQHEITTSTTNNMDQLATDESNNRNVKDYQSVMEQIKQQFSASSSTFQSTFSISFAQFNDLLTNTYRDVFDFLFRRLHYVVCVDFGVRPVDGSEERSIMQRCLIESFSAIKHSQVSSSNSHTLEKSNTPLTTSVYLISAAWAHQWANYAQLPKDLQHILFNFDELLLHSSSVASTGSSDSTESHRSSEYQVSCASPSAASYHSSKPGAINNSILLEHHFVDSPVSILPSELSTPRKPPRSLESSSAVPFAPSSPTLYSISPAASPGLHAISPPITDQVEVHHLAMPPPLTNQHVIRTNSRNMAHHNTSLSMQFNNHSPVQLPSFPHPSIHPDALLHQHFFILPESVFKPLHRWYHATPVLRRRLLASSDSPRIMLELFPLQLVCATSLLRKPIYITFSRSSSLRQLTQKICQLLQIEQVDKVRLYQLHSHNSSMPRLLDTSLSHVSLAQVLNAPYEPRSLNTPPIHLYLQVQLSNGRWPDLHTVFSSSNVATSALSILAANSNAQTRERSSSNVSQLNGMSSLWNIGNTCFPESDTRVLTDRGFLFLQEILDLIAQGDTVLFASYDVVSKSLFYEPGELYFPPRAPPRLVEFTQRQSQHFWPSPPAQHVDHNQMAQPIDQDEAVVDHGHAAHGEQDEAEDCKLNANRLSIRVTPDHDMYVLPVKRGHNCAADLTPHGFIKMKAEELTAGYQCHCTHQASCNHGLSSIRMLSVIEGGVAVDNMIPLAHDPLNDIIINLQLTTPALLNAFLEFYGYWLGNGSLGYLTNAVNRDAVTCYTINDVAYLKELISRCGLVEGADWCFGTNAESSGITWFHIYNAAWYQLFESEYWVKYETGRKRRIDASGDWQCANCQYWSARQTDVCHNCTHTKQHPPDYDITVSSATATSLNTVDNQAALMSNVSASPAPKSPTTPNKASSWPPVILHELQRLRAQGVVDASNIESTKWFWYWVWKRLNREQLRLVLQGIRIAGGCASETSPQQKCCEKMKQKKKGQAIRSGYNIIYTSSLSFRDELVRAGLHAGYSPIMGMTKQAGSDGQSCSAVPSDGHIYNREQMEEAMRIDPTQITMANDISWWVSFSSCNPLVDVVDVKYKGDNLVFKNHAGNSSSSTTCQATQQSPLYNFDTDGRLWCVRLPDNTDHLIIAQRAKKDEDGRVIQASRPIVIGNCYLNAALQPLSFTRPLCYYFLTSAYAREICLSNPLGSPRAALTLEFGSLLKQLHGQSERFAALSPWKLKEVIGEYREEFAGNQQHDAQEMISLLLDTLHEDLSRIATKPYISNPDSEGRHDQVVAEEQWKNYRLRNDSVIVDLFTGLLKSQLHYSCGRVSTTFDPYTLLSLPLPKPRVQYCEVCVVWKHSARTPIRYSIDLATIQPNNQQSHISSNPRNLLLPKISDFLRVLSGLCGIAPHHIQLVDVHKHSVFNFFQPHQAITEIRSTDHLYAYELNSVPTSSSPSPTHSLPSQVTIGAALDVCDTTNKWLSASIIDIRIPTIMPNSSTSTSSTHFQASSSVSDQAALTLDSSNQHYQYLKCVESSQHGVEVLITYDGWAKKWDEWIPLCSSRIAPARSRVNLSDTRHSSSSPLCIQLMHRQLNYQGAYFMQSAIPTLFNRPILLHCSNQSITSRQLYGHVWRYVRRYAGSLPVSSHDTCVSHCAQLDEDAGSTIATDDIHLSIDDTWPEHAPSTWSNTADQAAHACYPPFLLKWTNRSGNACSKCNWPKFCLGCTLQPNDELVTFVAPSLSLCIDWSPCYVTHSLNVDEMHSVWLDASVTRDRQAAHMNAVNIGTCMAMFTQAEKLEGIYCSKCKQQENATKTLELWSTPPILVLHLKRLLPDTKLLTLVDFPLKGFDPSPFLAETAPAHQQTNQNNNCQQLNIKEQSEEKQTSEPSDKDVYDLYAVINHLGASSGGHYTNYILDVTSSNEQWYCFDDSKITTINTEQIVASTAYMLFYAKRAVKKDFAINKMPVDIQQQLASPLPPHIQELLRSHERSRKPSACPACLIQ